MGKRKSKAPPPKKVQPKLDTTFTCPFCNHEKSVSAKLDFQQYKGLVECSVCGQKYACTIDDLSAAIDVYSDWIDACERLNAPGGGGGGEDDDEEEEEEDRRKEVRAADVADEELRKKKKKKQKTEGKRKDDEYEKDFIDSEEDEEEDFGDDSESD